MRMCYNCKRINRENDKYCRNCGLLIKNNKYYILINIGTVIVLIALIFIIVLFTASYLIH